MPELVWRCRGRTLTIGRRPIVMGIVNVTPDSFSDGGRFFDPAAGVEHGLRLAGEGADILDVGGESSRPGADMVPVEEEVRRVVPVVAGLVKQAGVMVSVDTTKAEVARRCLDAGAEVVNDITGLLGDPDMPAVCAAAGAGVVVMHMQGTPQTMQANPQYADVVREVVGFCEERLRALAASGIPPETVCLDPGIGFGKTRPHNLELLANLGELTGLGRPVCLGVSRKGFIGRVVGRDRPAELAAGSLAVACFAAARGHAHVLRVHDVAAHRDAALMLDAIDAHSRG